MIGEGNFGTIEIGKKADLILIDGSPFDNIHNTKKIHGVMASGQWFDKRALQKMTVPGIPVTVIQSVVKTIPVPEVRFFTPSNGATLKSATPTFSWKAVRTKELLYYRLEINKPDGGRVYSTGYVKNMRSHTIPEGVLRSGQSYRWRIRIADGGHWKKVQNSTRCAWQIFHIK